MTTYDIPVFASISIVPVLARQVHITSTMLSLIAEEPRKVIDLADMLECSVPQIVSRLRRLEAARKVQRQRVNNRKGFYLLWYIAVPGRTLPTIFRDEPKEAELELEEELPGAGQPIRKIVSVYTIDTPRDPWIAAVFGPAQREVA